MGAPILRPAAAAAASPPVTSHSAPTPVPPSLQPPASPSKPTQLLINAFKAINAIKSFRGSSVSFSRRDSKESPPPPKPVSFCHLVEFLCKRYSKDQNVHSIRQIFSMIDLNGDGTIAPDEMDVVLKTMEMTAQRREAVMRTLFPRKHHSLGWNLFHKVILAEERAGRLSTKVLQVTKQAFDNLDSDASGSVSAEEMGSLLRKMGVQLEGDKFMELVAQIDIDGDGEITFYEFLQAMCSDSGLLRSELGSVFNPTKLATVDAYVLSSSVEEIEKIMDTKSLALFSRIAVNILERLHTRKQRRLQTKTKTLRDLYEENMHQALEGALNDVMEQVEGRLGDLEEALDDASQVEGNTPPGGDVELREGMSEELIDHDQRRRLRIIMNMAIVRSFVAGLICGMIAFCGELVADYYWGEQSYVAPDEAGSSALETINHGPFWQHALLKYGIGLMATVVELLHLYYDMMISVLNMTEVVKLQLYPLTPERAFLVHGFTNVALEVGFSQLPNYGVNPLRNLSKWRQYLIQLLYASKGGVSKFLVKSALKRVLLRVGMRGAGSAVAFTNLLAVPIICIINSLVAISIVNGAHVVCIGSWYAITMLDALLNQQQHLRPEVQRALLQAVGCVAVLQTQWHANTELSLKHLLSRLKMDATKLDRLDDLHNFTHEVLPNLKLTEQYLVLRVLALVLVLAGRVSPGSKVFMKECLTACRFWSEIKDVEVLLTRYMEMKLVAKDVLTLFHGYHVKGGSDTEQKNQYWEAAKDIAYKMSSLVML